MNGDYFIYGSPWNGKECIGNNTFAPLRYIIILERAEKNEIHEVSPESAYVQLLKHTHFPASDNRAKAVLSLLPGITRVAKFFRLKCTADRESAVIAYRGIHHMDF